MNLTQIRYFHTVCTYKTVSAAAQQLHISQPSLSNAIKELENEFGVILFRRHHHGMELTTEGEVFLNMSRELLSHAEKLEHTMNNLGIERNSLRLGIPPMFGALILPCIYNGFKKEHPEIQLKITEGGREELLSKLNEDFLDIAFIPHTSGFPPELDAQSITQLEIVCCTSKSNVVSKNNFITASQLTDIPLILFKDSFLQTSLIKQWFALSGVQPRILFQTQQLSSVQTMIKNTEAAGFMFRALAQTNPNLVLMPVKPSIYVNMSLVRKKDSYSFDSMKKFTEFITQSEIAEIS